MPASSFGVDTYHLAQARRLDRAEVAISRNLGGSLLDPSLMLAVKALDFSDDQGARLHKVTAAVARLPPCAVPRPQPFGDRPSPALRQRVASGGASDLFVCVFVIM